MTTEEDWEFREGYLIGAAKRLEVQAAELMRQANDLREQAAIARANQQLKRDESALYDTRNPNVLRQRRGW